MQNYNQSVTDGVSINRKFYGGLYKQYWKRHFAFDQRYKAELFYQYVERLNIALEGLRILDFGFGYGNILWRLPKDCEILGIEVVPEAIKNANFIAHKKGYAAFAFYHCEGYSGFPIDSGTIDLVVASHVIEHVPDDGLFLMEINRVLKIGRYGIFLAPINELIRDSNHLRKTDLQYFQLSATKFGFELVSSWTADYIMPYTTSYWVRRYHEKLGLLGRVGSITWNLFLSSIPNMIYRRFDEAFEKKGKLPHQLLVCMRKLHEIA